MIQPPLLLPARISHKRKLSAVFDSLLEHFADRSSLYCNTYPSKERTQEICLPGVPDGVSLLKSMLEKEFD